jgi:hypothetical protein
MSSASGINVLPIKIFPSNQSTTSWTGNSTPVTFLDKGSYSIIYNYGITASSGPALTSTRAIITRNAPYGSPGAQIVVANSDTGGLGGGVSIQSMMNNIYIDVDNTPIYLNLTVEMGVGTIWGIQIANTKYIKYSNRINIIQV